MSATRNPCPAVRRELEAWELELGNSTDLPTFATLEEFVEGRIRVLEMIGLRDIDKKPLKATKTTKPAARALAIAPGAQVCFMCAGSYYIAACLDFAAKTVEERRETVITKRLCFNCLGPHRLSECRSAKRCRICSGQHHTLLHTASPSSAAPTTAGGSASSGSQHPFNLLSPCTAHPASPPRPALSWRPRAFVSVISAVGHSVEARALLDQGSELSFIRESLAQSLALPRKRASIPVGVSAYVLPRLTGRLPASPVLNATWAHIDGLTLADGLRQAGKHLILGADVYEKLLRAFVRWGAVGQPVAQHTALGWIVFGPITGPTLPQEGRALSSLSGDLDFDLHEIVSRFWAQEEFPLHGPPPLSESEAQCESHFIQTHSRSASGRYVRLPFQSDPPALGDSYFAAVHAFRRTRSRFEADPELKQLYTDFMREYEALGHMAPALASSVRPARICFLPHHSVLRKGALTSKLCVVFNGSLRSSASTTLNDHLHVGPKLKHDIADILLRWRCYSHVFLADVEKMYRQIIVRPEDRDFQRILWSTTDVPGEFQLGTVTYGLACAPFLALRVIKQLADDDGHRYPEATRVIRENMYVDDVLSGIRAR
ncbi:PREDICTED: uncharacterized protein LOC105450630 [Wasmannia auropunctata]|uniref:uncharacterized protein LOC105450630 n=1 Tax=Wasmannia auropunctata TaxID=64793 RepID=UPI0005F07FA7|nr:PREDICTED: uncharacterized protein LOC105450630 [Wasmannia auropunctata]